ncbi:MAG: methionine--tRNA ligase [Chthoniobacterales bacterium]|nr:MAG: methionine--tRNA ligase [Chthoniobacterales bacterium]
MSRYLITSALPYINGVKHLGNLVGSMLPADAYARFQRARGREVLFICATDEHGTPAELAAHEAGMPIDEYCARMHSVQKDLGSRFGLSFDHFGRSHSPQNHEITQHFYHQLDQNGLLEERSTRQVYSIDDKRFLPDRYVVGTCPHCGYESARGDQCENCTRVLDPADLINPHSAISGSTNIEIRDSNHLFLKQSLMVGRLREWIDSRKDWPLLVTSIARKWLDEGLNDRSITRDLSWGIPVAYEGKVRPGFEGKVFYVWFDAPIEYIGATMEWADATKNNWKRWWREDEGAGDVRYVQVMGKDNVPFHTVGFPVTLFGSEEPWKVVDYIKGLNWMNYYGGKFSTSGNRGIFMDQALELLPADYWRWYLLANAPEPADSNFTWEHFQATINHDLADVLGNFVNRIAKFCTARFEGRIPDQGEYGPLEIETTQALEQKLTSLTGYMEALDFRKSTSELRSMWVIGNEYLQRAEPWMKIKTDPASAGVSIRYALNLALLFASLAQPFIPETSAKITRALNNTDSPLIWPRNVADRLSQLTPGAAITVPEVLFAKIEDSQVAEWAERFGGAEKKL